MSQTFYYAHIGGAWTVNLGTQAARLGDYGGYSMKAETGAVGNSTVVIDDPNATVGHSGDAILGLQEFYVTESDCPAVGSNGIYGQRLYTGYTRERTYRRGTGSRTSLITGVEREIEVTLEDPNSASAWRILYETTTPLTGTVSKASGNTTITGTSTHFLSELGVNFTISIPGGGGTDYLYVSAIASDTSLTVYTAPTHTASGQAGLRVDAARPAETDVQRVQWLLSGYIAHPALHQLMPVTNDAGWVDTSGPVNMDAVDYTGQTPADVLHDCALASGKDWWIGYWEATGNLSLWYADSNTSTTYSSPLLISNVLTAVYEVTTFAPEFDAALTRSPARTFSGIYEPYTGGNVYVSNPTTASNYAWRDGSAPNSNRSTLASATADANRLLVQDSVEEDRITARVRLPSSLATGIKVGQRVSAQFSHLPGYGSFTWMRVASLQVQQDEATDKRYTLSMELTPQKIVTTTTTLLAFLDIRSLSGPAGMTSIPPGWTQLNTTPNSAHMEGASANGQIYAFYKNGTDNETNMSWVWTGSVVGILVLARFSNTLAGTDGMNILDNYGGWPGAPYGQPSASVAVTHSHSTGLIASMWILSTAFGIYHILPGAGQTTIYEDTPGSAIPVYLTEWSTFSSAGPTTVGASVADPATVNGNWAGLAVALATSGTPTLLYQSVHSGLNSVTVSIP